MLTNLGQELAALRVKNGDTQAQMAKKLGISGAYLSYFSNGVQQPPVYLIDRLKSAYNLTEDQCYKFSISLLSDKNTVKVDVSQMDTEKKVELLARIIFSGAKIL